MCVCARSHTHNFPFFSYSTVVSVFTICSIVLPNDGVYPTAGDIFDTFFFRLLLLSFTCACLPQFTSFPLALCLSFSVTLFCAHDDFVGLSPFHAVSRLFDFVTHLCFSILFRWVDAHSLALFRARLHNVYYTPTTFHFENYAWSMNVIVCAYEYSMTMCVYTCFSSERRIQEKQQQQQQQQEQQQQQNHERHTYD